MLEKEIEKYLTRAVDNLGGRAYKFISPGQSGVPDRIIFLPGGKIYFIELKTEVGKLSKLQRLQIHRLKKLGHEVKVLYGMEDVKEFINEITTT